MRLRSRLIVFVLVLSGCGAPNMPWAPSPVEPTGSPVDWFEGYTLTPVSLSLLVYEATPTGRVPIPGVSLHCERCGQLGRSWGATDANGFYRFSGGGVWLAPGKLTSVLVVTGNNYEDAIWFERSLEVLIADDTRLDVELVRRPAHAVTLATATHAYSHVQRLREEVPSTRRSTDHSYPTGPESRGESPVSARVRPAVSSHTRLRPLPSPPE